MTIFFFLSGYLITTLLRIEFERTHSISLKAFYQRRLLRIFPPLYITLFVGLVLTYIGFVDGKILLKPVLAGIFHLTNYWNIFEATRLPAGLGVLWSLAVEEHFYVFFPALYLFLVRRYTTRRQLAIMGAICAVILIWRLVLVYHYQVPHVRTYAGTDTRIDSILFGCMLAIYPNPLLDDTSAISLSKARGLAVMGIGMLLFSFVYRSEAFRETIRYTLQGVALFPIFFFVIKSPHSASVSWLEHPIMKYLGTLSYTLYLIHLVMLHAVARLSTSNRVLKGLLALPLSILFAALMNYIVEKPIARLRSQLVR